MTDDPPICICTTAIAVNCGGFGPNAGWCRSCGKPILSLHPRLISGLRIWPQLAHQTVISRPRHFA